MRPNRCFREKKMEGGERRKVGRRLLRLKGNFTKVIEVAPLRRRREF